MEELTTQEIVRRDIERDGNRRDWRQVYADMHKLVASNKFRIMRSGNTLYLYEIADGKNARMWALSADDDVESFVSSGDEYFRAMKAAGFQTVSFDTNRQAILRLLRQKQYQFESSTSGPVDPISGSNMISVKVML